MLRPGVRPSGNDQNRSSPHTGASSPTTRILGGSPNMAASISGKAFHTARAARYVLDIVPIGDWSALPLASLARRSVRTADQREFRRHRSTQTTEGAVAGWQLMVWHDTNRFRSRPCRDLRFKAPPSCRRLTARLPVILGRTLVGIYCTVSLKNGRATPKLQRDSRRRPCGSPRRGAQRLLGASIRIDRRAKRETMRW